MSNGGAAGSSSNTDGGASVAAFSFTFDHDTDAFGINPYNPPDTDNLVDLDGGPPPTVTWDGTVGSPGTSPVGSLKVDATFTAYNQFVLTSVSLSPLINATGKTIHALVMVDAVNGGSGFTGGVQVEANSGANSSGSASGAYTTLTPGTWKEVTLPLTAGSSFDPSLVGQISLNFTTGAGTAGVPFGAPVHAVFHVDTITDGSGAPPPPALDATFDSTTEGFYVTTSAGTDAGAPPTVMFDGTTGSPSPGSLAVALPFSSYAESYGIEAPIKPMADLHGKTIHAKVMLDKGDGGSSNFDGGYVQLYVETGSTYVFATGAVVTLTPGTWTDLALTVSSPVNAGTGYDPTQVMQVGVQIAMGALPDGGTFGTPRSLMFHIDSIVAQ